MNFNLTPRDLIFVEVEYTIHVKLPPCIKNNKFSFCVTCFIYFKSINTITDKLILIGGVSFNLTER